MDENSMDEIIAARNMDWLQVTLNQGPPCFHLLYENDGTVPRFCGRAKRWDGHHRTKHDHPFISLENLLTSVLMTAAVTADKLDVMRPGLTVGAIYSAIMDLAEIREKIIHGQNCQKRLHTRTGYLHGEDDDTPYMVDGLKYCGRCHTAL